MIYVPYRDVDSVGVLQCTSTSAGPQHTRLLQLQHSGWMAGRHQNGPVQRELCQWRPHNLWSCVSDDYGVCFRYLPYSSTDSHRSFSLSYRTRCYSHQKHITVNLIDSRVCLDHTLTVTLCSHFSDTSICPHRDILRVGVILAGHQKKILNSVQMMRAQMNQIQSVEVWFIRVEDGTGLCTPDPCGPSHRKTSPSASPVSRAQQ